MFRPKSSRHSNTTPPDSPPYPRFFSSSDASSSSQSTSHSNPQPHTQIHPRSRLRVPWRRAKSGADAHSHPNSHHHKSDHTHPPHTFPTVSSHTASNSPLPIDSSLIHSTQTDIGSEQIASSTSSLLPLQPNPPVPTTMSPGISTLPHTTGAASSSLTTPPTQPHHDSDVSNAWTASGSAPDVAALTLNHSVPPESTNDGSFANPVKHPHPTASHPHLRPGPFQRISNMFKESDGRFEENLRSTKRRIVQVRRQPDSAPVRLQMGFRSRTGWEPIRAAKQNQDCLVALVPWGPGSRYNLFAALDGHGRHGHQCALFIAQRVVSYLSRSLLALSTKQAIVNSLHKAIVLAERKLELVSDVDYNLSGSTGVFVIVYGTTLFCANVGDSRAILGRSEVRKRPGVVTERRESLAKSRITCEHRRYSVVQISFDHKPRRPDEKERLLSCGARVDAWESIEDDDERIWLPDSRTPGLAVSRTFGDLILKPYGVIVTPEIYSLELCEQDRFVVMASDGVFEFMSNEDVAEIVGRWRDRGSAQDAAEELVRVATDRWVEDDSVIDDISCVVVFVNVRSSDVDVAQAPQRMDASFGTGSDHDYTEEESSEATGEESSHAASTADGDRDDGFALRPTLLPPVKSVRIESIGRPNGIDDDFFANTDDGTKTDSP